MKKLILLFVIYCALLIPSTRDCFGQSITWQRIYDNPNYWREGVYSLCEGDGNNFYAIGYANTSILSMYILKLNSNGDTLWTRTIDFGGIGLRGDAAYENGSDGCIVTGWGDSAFVLNINSNGNINWYNNYSTGAVDCLGIIKTLDGGYIACGRQLGGNYNGYVLRTDSSGNLIWQKVYPSTEFRTYGGVVEADNGGFVLAGDVMDAIIDTQHVLLTRINDSGNIIWEKRYYVFNKGGSGNNIIKSKTSYLVAGTTVDSSGTKGNTYFMRVDTVGNIIYAKRFATNKSEVLEDIKVINVNKYIITASRDSSYGFTVSRIFITDSLGNVIRERIFTNPFSNGYIWFQSLLIAPNGDFISAGAIDQYNQNIINVIVARMDSNLYAPPIGIKNHNESTAKEFNLLQNFPNPFNPVTTVRYAIEKKGNIKLNLYNIKGQLVSILVNEFKNWGEYEYELNANKNELASGVYFVKLETEYGFSQAIKIVLIK